MVKKRSLSLPGHARQWNIKIGKKAEIIECFSVPINKLDGSALRYFLRASVARYAGGEMKYALNYFVNERNGEPQRSADSSVVRVLDPERAVSGYFCGTWECYAEATFELSENETKILKKYFSKIRQTDLGE